MKNKFATFCFGFLGFAFVCFSVFFFFSDLYVRKNIEFTDYETMDSLSHDEALKLAAVHDDCFKEERAKKLRTFFLKNKEVGARFDKRAFEERLASYLEEGNKLDYIRSMENVTLARYQGNIIGLYLCSSEDRIIQNTNMIWNFCLSSSVRGKGISHLMIDHAIKRCSHPGQNLALMVYKDSLVAQKLYKKHGFIQTEPLYSLEDEFEYYDKFLMKHSPKGEEP